MDAVDADAKLPAKAEAAKGPEQAPSKDAEKARSNPQKATEVKGLKEDAKTPTEEKPADSQQDAEAPQKDAEPDSQISTAARDGTQPEEGAAVETPATESKPQGLEGAAAADKGAGREPAQAPSSVSQEVDPQAAPSDAAVAEVKPSISKPDGGERKDEQSANQQMPGTSAAAGSATPAGSAKPAESESEPQGEVSKGEASGEKEANLSDEQKAILERGGSLLAEADEVDPKGIQLIRHMQVGAVL